MEGKKTNLFPKIEISQKGIFTDIKIDGQPITGVRAFSISQKGGQLPTLSLDLLACDMTIDMTCIPKLPEVFEAWYRPILPDEESADSLPLCID